MPNTVDFFAINADDVPRARTFYQEVFGWSFEPWGPPGFYLIVTGQTPDGAHSGALQERRELVPEHKMIGYECTIAVENIDQTIRAIEANGGRLAAPKFHIPTVGTVAYFLDTEGNVAGIRQPEKERVTGTVLQVNVSQGGIPKRAIPSGELTHAGITGDAWRYRFHGGPKQAVLLITIEGIEELAAQGFRLSPGALGENLTTRGLDRRALRFGQRLQVGDAIIELTKMRQPCATLNVFGPGIQAAMYDARVAKGDPESPLWGLSGFYASVVTPGTVRPGDAAYVVAGL